MRFEQAAADFFKRPGVVVFKELAVFGVEHKGFGDVVKHPIVHLLRGGLPTVNAAYALGNIARALVAVALHALDPFRVEQLGACHTADFVCQIGHGHAFRLARVAVIALDGLARYIARGSRHAPVVAVVAAAAKQVVFVGGGFVEGDVNRAQAVDELALRFGAKRILAVGIAVPVHEDVGQIGLGLPGRCIHGQIHASGIGAGLGRKDAKGGTAPQLGLAATAFFFTLEVFQRVLAHIVHLKRLIQRGNGGNGLVHQLHAVGEVVAQDARYANGHIDARPPQLLQRNDLEAVDLAIA